MVDLGQAACLAGDAAVHDLDHHHLDGWRGGSGLTYEKRFQTLQIKLFLVASRDNKLAYLCIQFHLVLIICSTTVV